MLSRLDLRGRALTPEELDAHFARPAADEGPLAAVRDIIDAVRARGDDALRDYTERFDGCRLDDLRVPQADLDAALAAAAPGFRAALELARDQITAYHRTQVAHEGIHERMGVTVRERVVPVDRAGLYVPGGRATYPSTVLMTAIPAQVAGVPEIALCVPPDAEGRVPEATLAAAALVGLDEVYRVGGAQAIAALAYGTESIRAVDVVVGPGNVYVSLAKREVMGVVGIESLAGPSELVVIADDSVPSEWVAIDLIAQAEHGPGGAAVLVTWDEDVADAVAEQVEKLTAASSRRDDIESTMRSGGRVVLVDDAVAAMAVANTVAPEHLQLMTADPAALVAAVRNAGAVFCGALTPAPIGDYVAGVNHVLPTARTARFSSALRVGNFQKHVHVVSLDADGLEQVGPAVEALASVEGLEAHGEAIRMRRERHAP
jgi:histidinol dehydrogenase